MQTAHPTQEHAQKYADAGFTTMPLVGKIPPRSMKNWPKKKYTPILDPDEFSGNFGVILQPDDLVIDVDPRSFRNQVNSYKILCTDYKYDFVRSGTFVVHTGGGGIHIYLKIPKKIPAIKHTLEKYPGVEFRSTGMYVVGPGSVHPDTKKLYTVLTGNCEQIHNAPDSLLELLTQEKLEPKKTDLVTDTQQAKARYTEYLLTVEPAVEGNFGDKHTFKVACRGKDLGLTEDSAFSLMLKYFNPGCNPPWSEGELLHKVKNAYAYSQKETGNDTAQADFTVTEGVSESKMRFDITDKGTVKKTLSNCVKYCISKESAMRGCFSYNEFSKEIILKKEPPWTIDSKIPKAWTDKDAVLAKFYLSDVKKFEVNTPLVHDAALVVANRDVFHPVKEYLDKLKWDGVSRLDSWLTMYCGVRATPYTQTVGRKFLIAAIRRVYRPGCKFDTMLALEGKQGVGKSQCCHILGGGFTGDINLDPHNKDTVAAIQSYWIVEVGEMVCVRKADVEALKSFLSRQFDTVRPAYGRTTQKFLRQCVFIGTINPEADRGYLRDTTGNRRFWPVTTHIFDLESLKRDRDQLWAEAKHYEQQNETIYIDKKEINDQAVVEQKARTAQDPWTDRISNWLEDQDKIQTNSIDIYENCLDGRVKDMSRREQVRISNIMQNDLGWVRKTFRDYSTGRTVKGFIRYKFLEIE